ncbi:hypothetical protein ANCCAN_21742 [Ancylostoma caninum]|uniref:Uncharacterized protein n=1 Tax=Ancylostoma caninum TaxID=29170 RepID=A0A368FK65_ANCCA|nr:hypothetical protein ANCCAN_21742 [Ancylostoma caninum]
MLQYLVRQTSPFSKGRFPIDIRSVQSDHEFLGPDSLRALYRRLNTLNRCAIMRIDQVVLRRRNDDYSYGMYDGFDDDDSVSITNGLYGNDLSILLIPLKNSQPLGLHAFLSSGGYISFR